MEHQTEDSDSDALVDNILNETEVPSIIDRSPVPAPPKKRKIRKRKHKAADIDNANGSPLPFEGKLGLDDYRGCLQSCADGVRILLLLCRRKQLRVFKQLLGVLRQGSSGAHSD